MHGLKVLLAEVVILRADETNKLRHHQAKQFC